MTNNTFDKDTWAAAGAANANDWAETVANAVYYAKYAAYTAAVAAAATAAAVIIKETTDD